MKQRIAELVTVLITGVFCTFLVAATNFPTNLDTYSDKTSSDVITAAGWNNMQDAIEACEAKIGKDGSAVTTSHDYKLGALETTMGTVQTDLAGVETTLGLVTSADLSKLHSITSSYTELNLLDADNRTVGDILTETSAGTMGAIAAVAATQYLKSAGVATKPAYGKLALSDTGVKIGTISLSSAGDTVVTGVGFSPSVVIFVTGDDSGSDFSLSIGFDDGTTAMNYCIKTSYDGLSGSATDSVGLQRRADYSCYGKISAKSSDGFTLTVSNYGHTANFEACSVLYLALP